MARRLWTETEIQYLREHYADNFTADIAKTLNRPMSSVYQQGRKLGLLKSPELIREGGRRSSNHPNVIASQFPKGAVPPNKGKKMPPAVYEKVKRTFFPKGHLPHNTNQQGDGALTKRGRYWYIRLELGRWRQYHTWLWEQANRKINGRTEMVKFIDGNTDNCTLENLCLISRADGMRANSIHRLPNDLKETIYTLTTLKRAIKRHEK